MSSVSKELDASPSKEGAKRGQTRIIHRFPRSSAFVRVLFSDSVIAILLLMVSFALYARTAAPGLLDGDEGEFQVNIFRLGVSHTGYPTFFLLGKLWTILVPIGDIATRANLFSAFWGALTVAAIFIFIRFLTGNRWAAIICALLLAASRVEWSQAIIPRPYTLNSFFVIVVPFLFFLWRVGKVDLPVPVFAFGLSLTNHRTMIWFAPAIALFVLWHARGALFKPRRLLALVIAFVLPLLLYGYVFWRGESDVGVEFHMKDFGDMVLGGNAREWWRFGPLDWVIGRVTDLYIPLLIEQFTAVGFFAGLIGAGALIAKRVPRGWPQNLPPRQVFLFILLANLGNTAFGVFFDTIDVEKFFLPSYITFLFFTGIGIAVFSDQFSVFSNLNTGYRILITAVFVGVTGFLVVNNFPRNDWSGRTDVAAAWKENLAQPLEEHALIVGPWESLTPLEYAMYVDGQRRDLERWKVITKNYLLDKAFYDSRQADIEKAVRENRPVYLTVYPGETETLGALVDKFRLTRVGDLWRVLDAPPSDIATINELRTSKPIAVFTDREGRALELLGYGIHPTPALRAGDFGLATLYWRMPQSFAGRLSISLRLTDAENHLISQRDLEPASGLRPTNGWLPNEVVQDDAGFFIPPDAPPGAYHLTIVVYDAATGENLKTEQGTLRAFALNDLNVARTLEMPSRDVLQIPHALDVPLPPLRLLGYALSNEQPKGGDVLDLSLWWQLDQPTAHGEQIVLKLRDASGVMTELYRGAPIADFPAADWGRAAILRGRYAVSIPIDFSGKALLVVESEGKSKEITAIDVQPSGRLFAVPRIAYPQIAQFGDSIKLLGYDLDKASVRSGETVRLTLYWQALKKTSQSYTVFAHALDASGVLRGQKDALPRNGELPTDRWLPGEVVADSYEIVIAPDAPPGTYQFEVGMYSAETGKRVSVTDAGGAQLREDRVLLGGFSVVK